MTQESYEAIVQEAHDKKISVQEAAQQEYKTASQAAQDTYTTEVERLQGILRDAHDVAEQEFQRVEQQARQDHRENQ